MPEVTVGSTSGYLAVPAGPYSFMSTKPSWLTPLARLIRLDYKPEAAEDSWRRIFAFFGEHLGPDPAAP